MDNVMSDMTTKLFIIEELFIHNKNTINIKQYIYGNVHQFYQKQGHRCFLKRQRIISVM